MNDDKKVELKLPLVISLLVFCLSVIFWILVIYLEQKGIFESTVIKTSVGIMAFFCKAIILYIVVLRYVSKPISRMINSNLESIEQDDFQTCLIERRDEIGVLSSSIKGIMEKAEKGIENLNSVRDNLNNVIEKLPEALFLFAIGDFKILKTNDVAVDLTGYPIENLLGMTLYDVCYSEDVEGCIQSIVKLVKGNKKTIKFRISKIDGELIWVEMSGEIIDFEGKRTLLAIVKDVSGEEKRLRDSSQFEDVISYFNQMVVITDSFQKISYVNNSVIQTLGYNSEELIGKNFDMLWSNKNPRSLYDKIINTLLKNNWSGECVLKKRDLGEIVVSLSVARIVRKMTEDASSFAWIMTDISSQKKILRKLQDERDYYKNLLDVSGIVFIRDDERKMKFWNRSAELITGYTAKEMVDEGTSLDILFPDKLYRKEVMSFFNKLDEDYKYSECHINTKDNKEKIISFLGVRLYDKYGNQTGCMYVGIDITEEKLLTEEAFLKLKREGISRLAGGIAHDFNNVLSGVLGYVTFAKTLLSESDKLYKYLDNIQASAESGKDVTNQLIMFSGGVAIQPVNAHINQLMKEVVEALGSNFPENIEIKMELEGDIPTIRADSEQIKEVLFKMAENAKEAMGEKGGILSFKAQTVIIGEEAPRYKKGFSPGRYILVSVEDTGVGISKENIEKIFDPFFSTKKKGLGIGLGLSVAYGIIKNHNGYIDVMSEVGKGSEFKVYFPFAKGKSITSKVDKVLIKASGETILIYDESLMVRELVVEILTELGYKVIPARDSIDAVELYRNNAPFIDLVLLDIPMPAPGSLDSFFRLKELNPNVKIIVTSSYGEHSAIREALKSGALGFIQKPYVLDELAGLIKRVLSRK